MTKRYHSLLKVTPQIHQSVFQAKGSIIIGTVEIGADSSIWYNTVLRGDVDCIKIGERTNIQDGAIVHVDYNGPCLIGNDVTIGHLANIHGCIIEDGCLIGMGAIILSKAHIKKGSVIAAGAVIKEGAVIDENSLMAGVPAKLIRTDSSLFEKNLKHSEEYIELADAHKDI